MSEANKPGRGRGRRGGRQGQRAGIATVTPSKPYITRKIPYYEVLDEE